MLPGWARNTKQDWELMGSGHSDKDLLDQQVRKERLENSWFPQSCWNVVGR